MGLKETYSFTGTVENVFYYAEDNGFAILSVSGSDKLGLKEFKKNTCTIKGFVFAEPIVGMEYFFDDLTLEYDEKYGNSFFKMELMYPKEELSESEQLAFLKLLTSSKRANALYEKYPNIVMDIVANPNLNIDLSDVKNIKEKTWNRIKSVVLENFVISKVFQIDILRNLHAGKKTIMKLISAVGGPHLLEKNIEDNPYILVRYIDKSFKTIDKAIVMEYPDFSTSDERLISFIVDFLTKFANQSGHTYINESYLVSQIESNVGETIAWYHRYRNGEENKKLDAILHFEGNCVGLESYWRKEMEIIEKLQELQAEPVAPSMNVETGIKSASKMLGFPFTETQKEVIEYVSKNNVCIINGYAGTGKTTVLRGLIASVKNAPKKDDGDKYEIVACAFSARAKIRISEVTGLNAFTIHKLLEADWNGEFIKNSGNPIEADVVLVDEASMINISLFHALITALPQGCKVVIVGDEEQLPAVGGGSTFVDILNMKEFESRTLDEILRQGKQSTIPLLAEKIRFQENPFGNAICNSREKYLCYDTNTKDVYFNFTIGSEKIHSMLIEKYISAVEKHGMDNVCFLLPTRKKLEYTDNTASIINMQILDLLIPDGETIVTRGKNMEVPVPVKIRKGARVIQKENDSERDIYNGDIGYVTDIGKGIDVDSETERLQIEVTFQRGPIVYYDIENWSELELAYCLTCHAAQGSDYKVVLVGADSTHRMVDSCWLYTAITRASDLLVLIVDPNTFLNALRHKNNRRNTWTKIENKKKEVS